MNKNFALIGAAGYIAPRHMKAIKETGNNLIAALDPYDGIGIMDSNFPDASFFTEFERFDRFVDKWHRDGESKIDFVSICKAMPKWRSCQYDIFSSYLSRGDKGNAKINRNE